MGLAKIRKNTQRHCKTKLLSKNLSSNTPSCYFSAGEFCGYFWSTLILRYLYTFRASLVLYETQLDNKSFYAYSDPCMLIDTFVFQVPLLSLYHYDRAFHHFSPFYRLNAWKRLLYYQTKIHRHRISFGDQRNTTINIYNENRKNTRYMYKTNICKQERNPS